MDWYSWLSRAGLGEAQALRPRLPRRRRRPPRQAPPPDPHPRPQPILLLLLGRRHHRPPRPRHQAARRGRALPSFWHTAAVAGCFASTETRSDCDYDADDDEEYDDEMGGGGGGGECGPETPWESMFQDLNPT